MKKHLCIVALFFTFLIQAQENIILKKNEITIPLGKKIILIPELEEHKVIGFKRVSEDDITEKKDVFLMLKNFKKSSLNDNTIEFEFSESEMMKSPIITLVTVQKTGKKMGFKAKIRLKGSPLYQPTSIVPAHSNMVSVEQWNDPVDSIFLYDFKLED
ncbi:hypothetical protein [Chryseobacterium camelliae]|uniref:hypothetical protein n=1 Tax=Chryseobacterium camelliae TaxID=1265445 RepID=UPI0028655529|nr:hypothetical protein [Chryseobacterium camelliae]MDR6514551.1 hypothetical protein [Chryseobacterium camelliae]